MNHIAEPNSPAEDVAEYFKALGGGSRADMADPPAEDDDDVYEKTFKVALIFCGININGANRLINYRVNF